MTSARTTDVVTSSMAQATKDIERFREFLHGGAPGPHAYVVLLGLDTFAAPDLLKTVSRGFGYRTFERLQRNTLLSFERLSALIGSRCAGRILRVCCGAEQRV
jgi:hypothetical protein